MTMTAALIDTFGMDREKFGYIGLQALSSEAGPHWITEKEYVLKQAGFEVRIDEILKELEQDPDVQAILAAGELAISKTQAGATSGNL